MYESQVDPQVGKEQAIGENREMAGLLDKF